MGYYPKYTIPQNEQAPLCQNPSTERQNLLLGVPAYGIEPNAPITVQHGTEYFNTLSDFGRMTDGKKHDKLDYLDPAFFHFTSSGGRTIVYKLNCLSAVCGFKMGFLNQDSVAVHPSRGVDVYLSENGKDWQRVVKNRNTNTYQPEDYAVIEAEFEKPYKALWLLIEMRVPLHVWVDQIELFGTTAIPEDALSIVDDGVMLENTCRIVNKYPDFDQLCGVHNVLLAYNCMPEEYSDGGKRGLNTPDQYLPYLAYYDREGKMVDTFFDSFLYLPYSRYTYSKLYKCASGWNYYVDNTFAENRNVDALEEAASVVEDTLKLTDYKVKVFLSILHTGARYGEHPDKFGDLDGDGVDENFDDFEDRKKAIRWIIDTQIDRFGAKERKHLELCGFYWFEEEINYGDPTEVDAILYAREYLHAKGYKLFWIPYYLASGYQDWRENGFDIACMQPNFAFRKKETKQILYDNAEITKRFGMCYEMEINGVVDPEDVERYTCYMDCGAEMGFMHSVKMYYQGGVPGEFYRAWQSTDPVVRAVYDNTYLYAKEKYVSRNQK